LIDRRALLAGISAAALIGPRRAFAATAKDAAGRAVPIYYHRPSLVEHIGDVSTWGGRHHRAVDFDRDWRASSPPPATSS